MRVSKEPLTPEEHAKAQAVFLSEYAAHGNVAAGCRKAGIHRSTVYRWQEEDDAFSVQMGLAKADYCDKLRQEIDRRATMGVLEPVASAGKVVAHVRKYSDTLLIFQAKAHMPEYRDKQQVEVSGQLDITTLAADADARFAAYLAAVTAPGVLGKPDPGAES